VAPADVEDELPLVIFSTRVCMVLLASTGVPKFILKLRIYKGFHRFGQAKFAYGGSVLGSGQFTLLPQQPLKKNDTQLKSGQN